jgi:hypothetical protein
MVLNLEILVDQACLNQSFDPLEGICCKALSVQLKFGFGSRPATLKSTAVSTRTAQPFSCASSISTDVSENAAEALRVEVWLMHIVRPDFLCGVAVLPWLLQLGRRPLGAAHMIAVDVWRGNVSIGKLTLQLTLRSTHSGLSKWRGIFVAQLKDMIFDARWARYQQDTALKGPVCSCGKQMVSLVEGLSGAMTCAFCGVPASLPEHTWDEGKTWRVTKEELFLDAFQVCRKCFHDGRPSCYCPRCAAAFGAGRQIMSMEPDIDTTDQI